MIACRDAFRDSALPITLRSNPEVGPERQIALSFRGRLTDADFCSNFKAIVAAVADPAGAKISLDFTLCEYADCIPLLSLAIWIRRVVRQGAKLSTLSVGGRNTQHQRLLSFLIEHGFLVLLGTQFESVRWNKVDASSVVGLQEILDNFDTREHPAATNYIVVLPPMTLLTNDPTLAPARLTETVNYWLAEILQRAGLDTTLADDAQIAEYKVRITLQELVDNAVQHAYPSVDHVAIYGRFHQPTLLVDQEPRINNNEQPGTASMSRVPGFEIYIVDLGRGLLADLPRWTSSYGDTRSLLERAVRSMKRGHTPLLLVSRLIFSEPVSKLGDDERRAQHDLPAVTGLQHVGRVMAEGIDGDHVRIYTNGTWCGRPFPWEGGSQASLGGPDGTAYVVYIRMSEPTVRETDAWVAPKDEETLARLRYSLEDRAARPIAVTPITCLGPDDDLRQKEDIVLLRLPSDIRKNDFYKKLEQLVFKKKTQNYPSTIIICDLPFTISYLLAEVVVTHRQLPDDLKIYFVSTDWRTCAFQRALSKEPDLVDVRRRTMALQFVDQTIFQRRHPEELGVTTEALAKSGPIDRRETLASVIHELRTLDTGRFWHIVSERLADQSSRVFITEPIVWARSGKKGDTSGLKTTFIDGYLDFTLAMADDDLRRICRMGLQRATALFPNHLPHASDRLITGLLNELPRRSATNNSEPLVVGSVSVTGSTAQRELMKPGYSDAPILHVFAHPLSRELTGASETKTRKSYAALGWLAPAVVYETPRGKEPYERIPGTPFVMRGGERAHSLARFKAPSKTATRYEDKDSYYGHRPSTAYALWDQHHWIRMGHWKYESMHHHDLLTINLNLAIRLDERLGGRIREWLRAVLPKILTNVDDWVCAYVSHPVSEVIASLLRKVHVNGQSIEWIPLPPIRSYANSSLRISPTALEAIKLRIDSGKQRPRNVLLLDDASITGHTMEDARQSILDLRPNQVTTICLLDRTGLPITRGAMESDTFLLGPRLWRWDVPPLGTTRSCPLCHALNSAEGYYRDYHIQPIRNRALEWIRIWSDRDILSDWRTAISPIRLSNRRILALSRDYLPTGQKIQESVLHINSTTLAAHLAELTRSTASADKALAVARELMASTQSDLRAAIEIISVQILLFFDDFEFHTLLERYIALFHAIWRADSDDPLTALAAICFELCPASVADKLWIVVEEALLDETSVVHTLDTEIAAVTIFRRQSKSDTRSQTELAELAERVGPRATARLRRFYGNLKPGAGLRDTVRHLFYTLGISTADNHASTLYRQLEIIAKGESDEADHSDTMRLSTILLSLSSIIANLESLDEGLILPASASDQSSRRSRTRVRELPRLSDFATRLGVVAEAISSGTRRLQTDSESSELRGHCHDARTILYPSHERRLNLLHFLFDQLTFDPAGDGLEMWIREAILPALKGKANLEFLPLSAPLSRKGRVVYCDGYLQQVVAEIFGNVTHARGERMTRKDARRALNLRPEEDAEAGEELAEADLWFHAVDDERHLRLILVNRSKSSDGSVSLRRLEHHAIEMELAVHGDARDGCYFTTLDLPFFRTIVG